MAYCIIQPPFTLNLREMSPKELKEYFQWFLRSIPERVTELAKAVQQTPRFEGWQPDYTPASLDMLGNWYATQVEIRLRSPIEVQKVKEGLSFPIEVSNEELTNKTFSLAMDIGMYLGEVMLKNHSSVHWDQAVDDKKFADYGQVVLEGFGPAPLNPVRIAVVLARSLIDKSRTGQRLRELYDYWSKRVVTEKL